VEGRPLGEQGKFITAGNASQLSDGAAVAVVMNRVEAQKRKLPVLGIYRGHCGRRLQSRRDGHRPVFAIPKAAGETQPESL